MMRAGVFAAVLVLSFPAGCSAGHSTSATIEVDAPDALVDQTVHVRLSGLHAGETVTVRSLAKDYQGAAWHGEATFKADNAGVVDLARTAPVTGSYPGVDAMGLFWSMRPPTGDPDRAAYSPQSPWTAPVFDVQLSVTVDGRDIATRTVHRAWMSAGVTHRTLDMATDKAIGELFLPATGGTPHPGVLMFGGSEGGVAMTFAAALLASHGYPVLALGYFGVPGLPSTLRDIPLEYFVAAAHMLSAQPVVVEGYSRGSEAALLLAQYYPGLVRGSILYAPNDAVFGAFPGPGDAWTNGGVAIPHTVIPVTNVAGPVLAIAGDDDALWGSVPQARQIMHNLDVAHVAAAHQALIYPGAGHLVGTFPYLPMGTTFVSRVTGATISHGGTQAADEAARSDGWPRVLSWLATLTMR